MLKKVIALAAALLLLAVTAIPAAAVNEVPSIEQKGTPAMRTAEYDGAETAYTVTSFLDATGAMKDELVAAKADLDAETDLAVLLGTTEDLDSYIVSELFDILLEDSVMDNVSESKPVVLTFVGPYPQGTFAVAYCDGTWIRIPSVVNADGSLTSTFTQFCPVMICAPETPRTGDAGFRWTPVLALAAGALIVGCVYVATRKKASASR